VPIADSRAENARREISIAATISGVPKPRATVFALNTSWSD
jgi:hypothetical protein